MLFLARRRCCWTLVNQKAACRRHSGSLIKSGSYKTTWDSEGAMEFGGERHPMHRASLNPFWYVAQNRTRIFSCRGRVGRRDFTASLSQNGA